MLLGSTSCDATREQGIDIPVPDKNPSASPVPSEEPTDSEDPSVSDDPQPSVDPQILSRIGQTPIICVYMTEYTTEEEFPTLEDVRCFTHINFCHARFKNKTTGDGGLVIKEPGEDYLRRLVAYKKSYPELKILLMIGGWGSNANGFSPMAANPAKRKLFCDECVRICKEFGLDGVDLDWEYPTYAAEGNEASDDDTANFTILMKELRAALGEDKIISYAASDSGDYIDNAAVLEWVDYINVMTYSMGDPPYHNSPLYKSELTRKRSGEMSIEIFHNQGVPYNRMNYGMAFYGHGDGTIYPSSVKYYNIKEILEEGTCEGKNVKGYNIRHWDDVGKNVYLGDASGKLYASYEDPESLGYRVEFLKKKGMLGALAWEYREDSRDGVLRKALRSLLNGYTPVVPSADPSVEPSLEPSTEPSTEPSQEPSSDPDGMVDLGKSGTANCYIVTEAGSYKFKAVQGNSSTSVGSVATVEVLWGSDCISSVLYDGGYVKFSTPATIVRGNALIGAKNSSGKILWSWHIWIPETVPGDNTYGMSEHPIMSRNLGALVDATASGSVDERSFGLLYQWGRKDPFPAATATDKTTSQISTSESISKPTTFVSYNGDWNSSADGDLWGDKSDAKTKYDPCPPGYYVPKREDVTPLFGGAATEAKGWSYNSGGWCTVGDPVTVFPLAGYIDVNGNYSGKGSAAKIWNSHHDSANSAVAAYGQFISSSTSASRSAQNKAQGASVRCLSVKKEEFKNAEGMPVMGSYEKTSLANVGELSGLCFSKDKDFMWAVGDKGYLYKLTFDLQATQIWTHDADLEGVTIDPSTGNLYMAVEPKTVYRLSSPYTGSKTTVFTVTDAENMGNNGMEGITWHKGNLYIGAQSSATLWEYTTSGTMLSKTLLGNVAPGIDEVGDLYYDEQTDLLWVSDSNVFKIYVFKGDVSELLAVYNIDFIGNPEAILVDHAHNCVWVGDDTGSTTSKIYKISFTGL